MKTLFLILAAAQSSGAADAISGEWAFSMNGPNGEVPAKMMLKLDGATVTGEFDFGGRKLTVTGGKFEDGTLTMTVKRTRDGGEIVYKMTGKVDGDKIDGSTTTDFMGQAVTAPWKATKKP
jgi:hypothetical protein